MKLDFEGNYVFKSFVENIKYGNKEKGIRSFVFYILELSIYLDWNVFK